MVVTNMHWHKHAAGANAFPGVDWAVRIVVRSNVFRQAGATETRPTYATSGYRFIESMRAEARVERKPLGSLREPLPPQRKN
jgi:hypothetical protein